MTNQNWIPGYELDEEEYDELLENYELLPVFVLPGQPGPGLWFTQPDSLVGIFHTSNGDFFQDLNLLGNEFEGITYLGTNLSQAEVIDLVVSFVGSENFEAYVAVFFNFDAARFEAEDDLIEEIPEHFWIRSSWLEPESTKEIHSRLLNQNKHYNLLTEFLLNPTDPKFSKLKVEVETFMDFSSAYDFSN